MSLKKQSKCNPHLSNQLWRSVNDIIGRSKSKSHDSGISANISPDSVNDFFSNVAVTDAHQPADQFVASSSSTSGSFQFTGISANTVFRMLGCLDIRKSTGPDGFSTHFLQEVACEIAAPLVKLYNASLQTRTIPSDWKRSNVTAVYKSGSRDDPSNFRPISVVPIIAKILEKLVAS